MKDLACVLCYIGKFSYLSINVSYTICLPWHEQIPIKICSTLIYQSNKTGEIYSFHYLYLFSQYHFKNFPGRIMDLNIGTAVYYVSFACIITNFDNIDNHYIYILFYITGLLCTITTISHEDRLKWISNIQW